MNIPAEMLTDRYWGSLLLLFAQNGKLQSYLTPPYIDVDRRQVADVKLKAAARPWSQSEKFMLDLALHLYNERNKVHLSDMDYLDPFNRELALRAIKVRFGMEKVTLAELQA